MVPAWYEIGTGLILLFAMIPLLIVEDYFTRNKSEHRPHKVFLYATLTFLTWNLGTTWWIWNASEIGMFAAFFLNTAQMSTVFWLFHITRRNAGDGPGYFGLIAFWLVFEHFYMNGEINWPWLNLGHGFANDISIIQWYEFTGAFGGTLWVLLTNILGFLVLKQFLRERKIKWKSISFLSLCLVVIFPLVSSIIIFTSYEEKYDPREIVVIQPNIDPYEKFVGMGMDGQMNVLLDLAATGTTKTTDYIIAPETFINDNVWEENMYSQRQIVRIYRFIQENYPDASFIVGLTYYKAYHDPENITETAREIQGTGTWYDSYNAAIMVDTSLAPQVYKKSKLVVGVEKMPYPEYLKFLRKLTLQLGGTFRSHGTQEYPSNFYSQTDSTGIAPVICFESAFGEHVTRYIGEGAEFIAVVTNDGWWGDTPGYRQHHSFSRLRAIETRRSVARSANTGISSLINQKGEILQRTEYWVPDVIRGELNANDKITFYTRHGDYIPRIAYFFSLLTLLYTLSRFLIHRKK
jgi:apolipoprotein N-acyltransferase